MTDSRLHGILRGRRDVMTLGYMAYYEVGET